MNKAILLFAGALLLVILVGAAFVFWPHPQSTPHQTQSGSFPVASSTTTTIIGTTTPQASPITVPARADGSPITVNDFVHNGVTVEDSQNPGTYYLAGSTGYCLPDGTCPSGYKTDEFIITYDTTKQFFTIDLTSEPLGQARKDAEKFLMGTLGIQGAKFCTLNYYLGTDVDVNETYAGKNLGFSFCPHATLLP